MPEYAITARKAMPQPSSVPADAARWTVSVSRDTDTVVRSFLARRGLEDGDLPAFVEEAVRWRVLDQAIIEARSGFADLTPEATEALIDEAVAAARAALPPEPS